MLQALKQFLHRAIVQQWATLEEEHAARPQATGRERAAVLGLYALAMLVLIATEYGPRPLYNELISEHVPRSYRRFGRDLSWCWYLRFHTLFHQLSTHVRF